MSILWQGVGCLILLEALLAAKEEFLSPVRDGEGLALGNITTADRVPDHLFFILFRTGNSSFGWQEGPFYRPVDDSCQNQNRNQTVHVLVFPS